jgi:MarR-like DNA-binding transcriptional regulator SgrR of sgrS sRNA
MNERTIGEKRNKIFELGKKGETTLGELADLWKCKTQNVLSYLHSLQEQKGYAYLVDGKGKFRLFKDFD